MKRAKLLRMRQEILKTIMADVRRLEGTPSPDVRRYRASYSREFQTYKRAVSKRDILEAIKKSDVVFGADFHTFAQSQRTHLRLLRELKGRPIVLALEMLPSDVQPVVDRFLASKISERSFLEKIKYEEFWGFPWSHYRVLFEYARESGIHVVGLNIPLRGRGLTSLAKRDAHAAKLLLTLRKTHSEALIYVIYGDLHLARAKLPRATQKLLQENKIRPRITTLFQNSELIYWRLARRGLAEKVDAVELRNNTFCILSAPPWIKWQGHLTYLETNHELVGDHEGDADGFSVDYHDQTAAIVHLLAEVWQVDGKRDDFAVYAPGDFHFLKAAALVLNKKELAWVEKQVGAGRSVFIPGDSLLYLAQLDVNQAAALAGKYLHSKLHAGRAPDFPPQENFLTAIWKEAVGFFSSKLVNHRRKSDTIKDLERRARVHDKGHASALLVLEYRLREQVALQGKPLRIPRASKGRNAWHFYEASRILGALMGNRMYTAFQSGQLGVPKLQSWLRQSVTDDDEFRDFYLKAVRELRSVRVLEQSKHERL